MLLQLNIAENLTMKEAVRIMWELQGHVVKRKSKNGIFSRNENKVCRSIILSSITTKITSISKLGYLNNGGIIFRGFLSNCIIRKDSQIDDQLPGEAMTTPYDEDISLTLNFK